MSNHDDGGHWQDPAQPPRRPRRAHSRSNDGRQPGDPPPARRGANGYPGSSAAPQPDWTAQPDWTPWPYGQQPPQRAVPTHPDESSQSGKGTYRGAGYDAEDPSRERVNPGQGDQLRYAPPGQDAPGTYGETASQPGQPSFDASDDDGGRAHRSPPARPSARTGLAKWALIVAAALTVVLVGVWVLNRLGATTGGIADPETSPLPTASAQTSQTDERSAEQSSSAPPGDNGMAALQVGQCIGFVEVAGAAVDPAGGSVPVTHEVVDCEQSEQFRLVVASVSGGGASCPNPDYVKYFQPDATGKDDRLTVCLAPVFEIGRCYAPDPIKEWVATECTDPASYFQIDNVLAGSDPAGCTVPADSFTFPEPDPGRVYCLVAP